MSGQLNGSDFYYYRYSEWGKRPQKRWPKRIGRLRVPRAGACHRPPCRGDEDECPRRAGGNEYHDNSTGADWIPPTLRRLQPPHEGPHDLFWPAVHRNGGKAALRRRDHAGKPSQSAGASQPGSGRPGVHSQGCLRHRVQHVEGMVCGGLSGLSGLCRFRLSHVMPV